METLRPPEVVRERVSRLSGGRVTCALIFDRELAREEIQRFYAQAQDETPRPVDFDLAGRVLRYECDDADESRWRLAAEIYLVKSFREGSRRRTTDTDARLKRGLRPLHR
ncbi:MAG TPA: hypothetical protein VGO79_07300 [Thermoanaerobaculia bacterium]|jgi:hypothetical protein